MGTDSRMAILSLGRTEENAGSVTTCNLEGTVSCVGAMMPESNWNQGHQERDNIESAFNALTARVEVAEADNAAGLVKIAHLEECYNKAEAEIARLERLLQVAAKQASDAITRAEAAEAKVVELGKMHEEMCGVVESMDEFRNKAEARNAALREKLERAEDGLQRIISWSEAYPLDIFPEPDMKLAHKALKSVGLTLDAISASNMRHVVTRTGEIALAALDRDGGG